MALGTGVHNLSLIVRAHNRASRALASVGTDLDLMDRSRVFAQKGFQQLSRVGLVAIKALAAGVAIAIGGAILAYSSFDNALTQSLAITEDVSPQIREQLQNAAREVAKTTVFSAKEAAAAYFGLFSAGQTVAQAMESLPVVAAFAQAGVFDLQVATEHLVTAQNALGLSFDDPVKNMREMKRVADVLAKADQVAVGGLEDFADALTNRAAAAMRTYNIDVEEGVAVLAAWANQGLKGKTAGEAFAIVTRDLQKAALKEADAWREAGAAVYDRSGNMRNMADIVGDLEVAMEGLTDAQKKQLLVDLGFQERSQARLLQLLGTSDAIREYEEAFRSAGGATQEVAEKQLDSATAQLKLLKNAIVDIFIGAGSEFDEGFKGTIAAVKDWVNEIGPSLIRGAGKLADGVSLVVVEMGRIKDQLRHIRNFEDFGNEIDHLAVPLQKLVFWIGEVLVWWDKLSKPVRDSVGDFGKLLPVIFLVAGGLKIVAAVLGLIASPALVIAAIIAGLIVLFKHLWENSQQFRDIISEVATFFRNEVVPILEDAWERIQEAVAIFLRWFDSEMLPWLTDLWNQVKDTFVAAWDFIVSLFKIVVNVIEFIWDNFGEMLLGILEAAWNLIKDVVLGAFQVLEGIFNFFAGLLSGDWEKMWQGLLDVLKGLWKIILAVLRYSWDVIIEIFTGAWNFLSDRWKVFWDSTKEEAKTAWNAFTGWFGGIWESFKEKWDKGWTRLKESVGNIIGGLAGLIKGPFNAVLDLVERLVNTGISGLNNLIELANKIPGVSITKLGKVSFPRLALGGDIIREGLALVGERGPELVRLAKGAQVAPLGSTSDQFNRSMFGGPAMHIEQVVFQGTPQSMINDWKRETKLALRGL